MTKISMNVVAKFRTMITTGYSEWKMIVSKIKIYKHGLDSET
jgi:hypothetical protein